MRAAIPFVAACLLPFAALAGRPLTTEDASTLDDRACQLEAWLDRTRGNASDVSFVPACAWLGVEWQAGATRTHIDGRGATTATFVQGKHAFVRVDEGAWGIGVVAGIARAPQREEKRGWGDPYLIVPLSLGIGDDKDTRALLHLNVGAARERDARRNVTLWGVAIEKPVTARLTLVAEAYGENAAKPFVRGGFRYALFEGFDVDLTWVTRPAGFREEHYGSLGFHWELGRLAP